MIFSTVCNVIGARGTSVDCLVQASSCLISTRTSARSLPMEETQDKSHAILNFRMRVFGSNVVVMSKQ